jgi:hypothetical protein
MQRTFSMVGSMIALAAACLVSACSTPSSKVGRLYASLQSDVAEHPTGKGPDLALWERHQERANEVREILAEGKLESRTDRFHAAVLLAETRDPECLALAEQLGREVGLEGEKLGFRVAAEAIDKQLVLRGLPQRYGTQYEWVFVLQAWRLYPIDPATTDADRRAMEIPPLLEVYEGEKRMNRGRS